MTSIPPPPRREPPGERTVVILLGIAQTIAWGSTYYLPAILAIPIATDLGITPALFFGGFSVALMITGVLGPFVGRYVDRVGGRRVLVLSNVVIAAGLLGLSQTSGPCTLFAAWVFLGIGMSMGLYEAAFATFTQAYGTDARAPITGLTLIGGLASTISWPLSAYVEYQFDWRTVCLMWVGLHILLAMPLNALFAPVRCTVKSSDFRVRSNFGTSRPVAPRVFWLLAFVFSITWFIAAGLAAHLPELLKQAGSTTIVAVAMAALVGPAQVAGRLLEFSLMKTVHPLQSAKVAATTHPIGAVAILVLGVPAAAVFTVLHGFGNGILTVAKGTLPLALFGASNYGYRQGLLAMPVRVAQAASPLIFAFLIDRIGTHVLLLTAVLSMGSFMALKSLRRDQERQSYETENVAGSR
jgi:MFS family permease